MVPASAAKYDNRLAAEYKKKLSERVKLDQAKYGCISRSSSSDVHRSPEDPLAEPAESQPTSLPSADDRTMEPTGSPAPAEMIRQQSPVIQPSVIQGHSGSLKTSKLGAVKANITFDQLEARAKEESKQKLLAAESQREANQLPASEAPRAAVGSRKAPLTAAPAPSSQTSREQTAGMERLGMGMRKMALSQAAPSAIKETSKSTVSGDHSSKTAGPSGRGMANAKSVSSDQYFKGGGGAEEDNATKERLRNIQGATSVSSNQFFNQDEEEAYPSSSGILRQFQSLFPRRNPQETDGYDDEE